MIPKAALRILSFVVFAAAAAHAGDVCPEATMQRSGSDAGVSWKSGTRSLGAGKFCTRHEVTIATAESPLPVEWPSAGILSVNISGTLALSFCCTETVKSQSAPLRYGASGKSLDSIVQLDAASQDEDYPDLIEEDAKTSQTSFLGRVWDGGKWIDISVELRSAASHPHFNQSVFQFTINDASSEAINVEWSLVTEMSKTTQPYFSGPGEGSKTRQGTYVFFGKQLPSPAQGVVELKNAGGQLLGRFSAAGFTPKK